MTRQFDLPPLWDGARVEWQGWETMPPTTAVFHLPVESHACDRCGSLAEQEATTRNVGIVHPPEGAIALYSTRRLHVTRCRDCGKDTVYDMETDECWDLDDTDYGPDGSYDETTLQGALF